MADEVRDMLRQLSQTGVATMDEEQLNIVSYTPRNLVTVKFCGRGSDDVLQNVLLVDPQVQNSKPVQFSRNEDKLKTIQRRFPEIVMEDTDQLVIYHKKDNAHKKVMHLDVALKEMTKRRRDLDIFVFIGKKEETLDNESENEPNVQTDVIDNEDRQNMDGSQNQSFLNFQNRQNTDGSQNQSFLDFHGSIHSNHSAPNMNRSILNLTPFSRENSPVSLVRDRGFQGLSPTFSASSPTVSNRFHEEDSLPEIHIQKWQETDEIPSGEEVPLDEVVEKDRSNLENTVNQIKNRPALVLEDEIMEIDETEAQSEIMTSQWSLLQLKEKARAMTQEFQDATEKDISLETFNLLCLLSAKEANEVTHVITTDEVRSLQEKNIVPKKPEKVDNIIVIQNVSSATSVSFVKVIAEEYKLTDILMTNMSQLYTTKLIIKDIFENMSIKLENENVNCKQIEPFEENDEKSFFMAMFLTIRKDWLQMTDGQYSLNEARQIVQNIYKSSEVSTSEGKDSDSDEDWYSQNQKNQKRIKLLESRLDVADKDDSIGR